LIYLLNNVVLMRNFQCLHTGFSQSVPKGQGPLIQDNFARMAADQKKMSEWSAILTLIAVEEFL